MKNYLILFKIYNINKIQTKTKNLIDLINNSDNNCDDIDYKTKLNTALSEFGKENVINLFDEADNILIIKTDLDSADIRKIFINAFDKQCDIVVTELHNYAGYVKTQIKDFINNTI